MAIDTTVTLADLTPDPRNARRHTPANLDMIRASLDEVGAGRSIVVDEDNVVLAGNATIEAAQAAGIRQVQIVEADGDTLIAVRRSNLTPEQKARLSLYDNRAAELAEWDAAALQRLMADLDGVADGVFSPEELGAVLAMPPDVEFPEYDESAANEVKYCECPACGHKFPK